MRWLILLFAALAGTSSSIAANTGETQPSDVEVMILGVYHFSSPESDLVNVHADDVFSPKRQRELENLVQTLAQWKPTRIAVEEQADGPSFRLVNYSDAERLLLTKKSETVQLGFRLAQHLGHEGVFGFDEQPREGEPDYFPFGKVQSFAERSSNERLLETLISELQAMSALEEKTMKDRSVAENLYRHNDPELVVRMHQKFYYSMLSIGDGEAQPGAELNAYWYMRNAKMFAKLDLISVPGDRVLVIVGSGHVTWLRHFVESMPHYRLVESMPYLIAAAALDASVE